MGKRRVEYVLYDENCMNGKCDKIKIQLGINREKVPLFHLDELSNYYFSPFGDEIKFHEIISVK